MSLRPGNMFKLILMSFHQMFCSVFMSRGQMHIWAFSCPATMGKCTEWSILWRLTSEARQIEQNMLEYKENLTQFSWSTYDLQWWPAADIRRPSMLSDVIGIICEWNMFFFFFLYMIASDMKVYLHWQNMLCLILTAFSACLTKYQCIMRLWSINCTWPFQMLRAVLCSCASTADFVEIDSFHCFENVNEGYCITLKKPWNSNITV